MCQYTGVRTRAVPSTAWPADENAYLESVRRRRLTVFVCSVPVCVAVLVMAEEVQGDWARMVGSSLLELKIYNYTNRVYQYFTNVNNPACFPTQR